MKYIGIDGCRDGWFYVSLGNWQSYAATFKDRIISVLKKPEIDNKDLKMEVVYFGKH